MPFGDEAPYLLQVVQGVEGGNRYDPENRVVNAIANGHFMIGQVQRASADW